MPSSTSLTVTVETRLSTDGTVNVSTVVALNRWKLSVKVTLMVVVEGTITRDVVVVLIVLVCGVPVTMVDDPI